MQVQLWLNDQHIWTGTGKPGSNLDLAGLVCNKLGDDTCINPQRNWRVVIHGKIE